MKYSTRSIQSTHSTTRFDFFFPYVFFIYKFLLTPMVRMDQMDRMEIINEEGQEA
jgi:hypothetical protein